jgi:hypothetical protein
VVHVQVSVDATRVTQTNKITASSIIRPLTIHANLILISSYFASSALIQFRVIFFCFIFFQHTFFVIVANHGGFVRAWCTSFTNATTTTFVMKLSIAIINVLHFPSHVVLVNVGVVARNVIVQIEPTIE